MHKIPPSLEVALGRAHFFCRRPSGGFTLSNIEGDTSRGELAPSTGWLIYIRGHVTHPSCGGVRYTLQADALCHFVFRVASSNCSENTYFE